jgi:6-phosphogluconolactonase
VSRTPQVEVLADPEAVCRRAAERFARLATAAAGARGRFVVALSGGHTPRRLHELLASPDEPWRRVVPWSEVHLCFGDERHVPPDHPDSNYRMARESLIEHVPIPDNHVHRIPAEMPADDAASAYERTLRALLPDGRFDLVLLGMGPEGHTASLFPGSPALDETARWVRAVDVPQLRTQRITCTPPLLNAARSVMFLVAGAEKAAALRSVLHAPKDPAQWPAQAIAPADGALRWLVDRAAARLLPSGDAS